MAVLSISMDAPHRDIRHAHEPTTHAAVDKRTRDHQSLSTPGAKINPKGAPPPPKASRATRTTRTCGIQLAVEEHGWSSTLSYSHLGSVSTSGQHRDKGASPYTQLISDPCPSLQQWRGAVASETEASELRRQSVSTSTAGRVQWCGGRRQGRI